MARAKNVKGICRLCGEYKDLSFEHVPLRSTGNDQRTIKFNLRQALSLHQGERVRGSIEQGGIGFNSLCSKCNSDTDTWYGEAFRKWCRHGMEIMQRSNGQPKLIYVRNIFPLRILKQIVVMFLAINEPTFAKVNINLPAFARNRYEKYLPPRYRFFVCFNNDDFFRYYGVSSKNNAETGEIVLMSQISFPPYGYLLTLDSNSPDERLQEITHFSRYGWSETVDFQMKLPVLSGQSVYPGVYNAKA